MNIVDEKWLRILNDDERVICEGPGQYHLLSQMRQKIHQLQVAINEQGYQTWVLYDDHGFRFICALLALLLTGRMAIVPASRNVAIIESLLQPGVGLIGSHAELVDRIDIVTSNNKEFENNPENNHQNIEVTPPRQWGQVAFCTSGSSGQPKIITKQAWQLFLEVENFHTKWLPLQTTLFVPLVTHLHVYGLTFAFLLPLFAGARFYLPFTPGLLAVVEPMTLTCEPSITSLVVVMSPTIGRQVTQIRRLAESGSIANHDRTVPISRIFCAGGKLTDMNAKQIINLFDCSITEIFGSTESGAVATREHHQSSLVNTNVWQLLPGLSAVAKTDTGSANTPATVGQFSVWGKHVGGSKQGPIMTGDNVKFVGHRQFQLLGRANDVCKIEGKRVSLSHVVEALENSKLVDEASVLPFEKHGKEILFCGVVLSERGKSNYRQSGKSVTDQLIREHLRKCLAPVLVPRVIRYLDKMPRNEMGKLPQQVLIDRLVNPALVTLPLIDNTNVSDIKLVLALTIPMELGFLRGHFDNAPIVPGIILLHWVHHFIDEYWECKINPAAVNRLKFSKPTRPGDQLLLVIQQVDDGVEFLYQGELKNKTQNKYAQGLIPLLTKQSNV